MPHPNRLLRPIQIATLSTFVTLLVAAGACRGPASAPPSTSSPIAPDASSCDARTTVCLTMHNLSDMEMSEIWGDSRHSAPMVRDLAPDAYTPYLSLPRLLTSQPVLLAQRVVTPRLTYRAAFPGPTGSAGKEPRNSGRFTLELRIIGNRIHQVLLEEEGHS